MLYLFIYCVTSVLQSTRVRHCTGSHILGADTKNQIALCLYIYISVLYESMKKWATMYNYKYGSKEAATLVAGRGPLSGTLKDLLSCCLN